MSNSINNSNERIVSNFIVEEPSFAVEPFATKTQKNNNVGINSISINNGGNNLRSINSPAIDIPDMDPDTAIIILMNIFDKNNIHDVKASAQLLKANNTFNSELNKEKLAKLKDQIEKIAEEAKKKAVGQTTSDIGLGFSSAAAVFAFIGALAFSIVTLGLGLPALAAATVGLTMSILDVGTRIAKATNSTYEDANHNKQPLDITLGGMVKRIVEQVAYDCEKSGVDYPPGSTKENREQKKSELIMITTLVLNISISLACIACSLVSLKSLASAGKNIGEATKGTSKNIIDAALKATNLQIDKQAARLTSVVADTAGVVVELANSATDIAAGVIQLELAEITKQKMLYENDIKTISSIVKMIQSDISNNQALIQNLIETSNKAYEDFSATLSNYYQSQLQVTSKI
jgi:hypothetical protein